MVTPHPPHRPDDTVVHFMVKALLEDLKVELESHELRWASRCYQEASAVHELWEAYNETRWSEISLRRYCPALAEALSQADQDLRGLCR